MAILDAEWTEDQAQQDGQLRVNWLTRRTLFDFDRVEIIQATDEDVERFVIQVGNDTDTFRQPRYKQMRCVVAPDCQLSENTWKILRSFFGQVEREKISKPTAPLQEEADLGKAGTRPESSPLMDSDQKSIAKQ